MKRVLLLVAAVALSGCNLDTGPQVTDNPSDPATETFAASLGVNISQMTKTTDGVYYKDLTVGTGAAISPPLSTPFVVEIAYTGFLKDASVFDTSADARFDLTMAIFGFQEGMLGMKVGGERLIVIPSELGYGANNISGIPPNSTLVFDVKLLSLP